MYDNAAQRARDIQDSMQDFPDLRVTHRYHHHKMWNTIASGLVLLATSEPSGDDSVFDYWPNALEALSKLYEAWANEASRDRIESYLIHHLYESLPADLAREIEAYFIVYGFIIVVDKEDHDYDYWPVAQREITY